jgi:hypothetical protein
VTNPTSPLDDRLSLEQVLERRQVPPRDCRSCAQFEADPDGRGFGWCRAHEQYVKLYHAQDGWYTQCQFKNIRLVRQL